MPERAIHIIVQFAEPHFLDVHRDRARFDLGQIENVVDEREQVVAGSMNRLRELDLLRIKIAVLVLRQLVGQR